MIWKDYSEGYLGPNSRDCLTSKSNQILRLYQDLEKQQERKALLTKYPHLRIRINTPPLKRIIDYTSFRCSPLSSIARDQAIFGSDIDAGLVIIEHPAPRSQQISFVDELRSQGFDAYHKSEINFVDRKVKRMVEEWFNQDHDDDDIPTEIVCWQITAGYMPDSMIRFVTKPGIERILRQGKLIDPVMIYLAGYNIE